MIYHPFALFLFAILVGGVALFVVVAVNLGKLFCGDASGGGARLRDDREHGPIG